MADNILKKEFGKKDVKRLRNLIKGKSGESSNSIMKGIFGVRIIENGLLGMV